MAVLIANNATGRLAGSIDATQASLSLQAGEGSRFPSPSGGDWFPITFIKPSGELEIMHCTSRTNDVLTVTRAQEGTSANTFASGDRCALRVTAAAYEDLRAPKGGIIKWSGAIVDIPTGWALCDGTGGTLDLTDRFVVGAGNTYAVGATGGVNSVTLTAAQMPVHKHTVHDGGYHGHSAASANDGYHAHSINGNGDHSHDWKQDLRSSEGVLVNSFAANQGTSNFIGGRTQNAGYHGHSMNGAGTHNHAIDVYGAGTHSHGMDNAGGGASHENRPPYFALAFIQKL